MKAMVIYDSQFGNTAQIAQAIGRGLGDADDVTVSQIADARPESLAGLDLLVVGSPTQKFRSTPATKDFLKSISRNGLQGVRVAAFDTRLTEEEIDSNGVFSKLVDIFGYAAAPIAKELAKKGGNVAAEPEGFYVAGTEGPLVDGELERAEAWAKQLVASQVAAAGR